MNNNKYLVNKIKENAMKSLFFICALASVVAVIIICVFIFVNGLPAIGEIGVFDFLFGKEWRPSHDKCLPKPGAPGP